MRASNWERRIRKPWYCYNLEKIWQQEQRKKGREKESIAPNPMAAALIFSPPQTLSLSLCPLPTPIHHHSLSRSPPHSLPPCACSAGTLDPDPDPFPTSTTTSPSSGGAKDTTRRRAVRIAWEKLVRWSRSWRSRNKSDVLEKITKVFTYLPPLTSPCLSVMVQTRIVSK
jgi:hypothetical protein